MSIFNGIKEEQMDILREVGNIGAGHSASAMAQLLNRKIDMEVPFAKLLSFDELVDFFGGADIPVASIFLKNGRRFNGFDVLYNAFLSGGAVYQRADWKPRF